MVDRMRAPVWMLKKAIEAEVGEPISLETAGGNTLVFTKSVVESSDGKFREVIDIEVPDPD
jgi:hypothetical protein